MNRAILLLTVSAVCATDAAPFFDKVRSDEFSPNTDILVQHYFERECTDQIWLVSTADPGQRRLLFTHQRQAEVIFSPDQTWLIINDHYGSGASRVLLYRRKSGLDFEQVADLTAAAWKFFDQRSGLKTPNDFDHAHVEALRWTDDDPPTLFLCLGGHSSDNRNNAREWYCLYDVRAKSFNTDLDAHNKKNTQLKSK